MTDYNKRPTIPNTAHGTVYQIRTSIYYAFTYAYRHNIPFELHTEDAGYGDFDDLVLILPDKVTAMQLKHSKEAAANPKEFSFSDFITASGNNHELMLYKYFDSLYEQLNKNKLDKHDFRLMSNYKLPAELSDCIDPQTGKFTDNFFSAADSEIWLTRTLIMASIQKHTVKEINKDNDLNFQPYSSFLVKFLRLRTTKYMTEKIKKTLFKFIKTHFVLHKKRFSEQEKQKILESKFDQIAKGALPLNKKQCKKLENKMKKRKLVCGLTLHDLANANFSANKVVIERFLKLISFNFEQHNSVALETEINNFFKEKFNTTSDVLYQACFNEFYQWLISPQARTLNNAQVRSLFDKWYDQYIQLERLNGLTRVNLGKIVSPAHYFARNDQESILKDFILDKSAQILVVVGEPGIGKSRIFKQVLNGLNWRDGNYLFLDIREVSPYLKDAERPLKLGNLNELQVICLDNAEFSVERQKLTTEYQELFNTIVANNKKLLLLYRSEPWKDIADDFTKHYPQCRILAVPVLEEKAILARYPNLQFLLDISTDFYHRHHANHNLRGQLSQLLGIPFYLNIMVQHVDIIAQHSEQSLEKFKRTIINIAITQPACVKSQEKNLLGKERKALLRELIFAKNKANTASGSLAVRNRQTSIDSLVKDGILVKLSDNSYNFSHLLYEAFMVGEIIDKQCKLWLETQDEPKQLLKWLQRHLSRYKKYLWAKYLDDSAELSELLGCWYTDNNGKNNPRNCDVLLYTAITTSDDELLDLAVPLINDLNRQLVFDKSQTTFLNRAIAEKNVRAVATLLKKGAEVCLLPEQRYDQNASSKDDNNCRVYVESGFADYDDYGLCVANYYKMRPHKYIFREGRDDPYNECHDSSEDWSRLDKYHNENQWILSLFKEALKSEDGKLFNIIMDHSRLSLFWRNINKENLLHLAVLSQEPVLVEKLIKKGYKIAKGDCDRETPLHNAIYCSSDAGQNPEVKEKSYQIFKLLLDAYARQNKSLDQKNVVGWTPLHLAILMRDQRMIRDLIQQGAKPNIIDKQGYSAKELLNKIEQEENIYLGSDLIDNSDLDSLSDSDSYSYSDLDSCSTNSSDDDSDFHTSNQPPFVNANKQSKITDFFRPNNKKRKLAESSESTRLAKHPRLTPTYNAN